MNRFAIVARNLSSTNRGLLEAAETLGLHSLVLPPEEAADRLRTGDVALGRLDVLPTVDGPEPGLETMRRLEAKGVLVLNRPGALLAAHDKLTTALKLAAHRVPHPRTAHVGANADPALDFPVVVKPRFGSWGRDVTLCQSPSQLERCLHDLGRRRWFRRQGALVQEFVEPQGRDLRILVATGEIVGAVERIAAPGEWRTNIALGGSRSSAVLPPQACLLALGAAASIGADLVGVDLLPRGDGDWVVLELNGAVDFTRDYSTGGEDVFERVVRALARAGRVRVRSRKRVRRAVRRSAPAVSSAPA